MKIDGIENGIVLDHIKAGKSMLVYKYLGLDSVKSPVALIQNCHSQKMGQKDIVKIAENIDLDQDGKRVNKATLSLPETLKNVLHCKNPRCITSTEQELPHIFKRIQGQKRQYRCIYCDTIAKNDDFE